MCTSPLNAIIYKDLSGSNVVKILDRVTAANMPPGSLTPLPCGQCSECRAQRARVWANRLTWEATRYRQDNCWFITLTYDNDSLIYGGSAVPTLHMDDVSAFIKRLRKHYGNPGIRFYAAGEYGGHTYRPHYHLILYGVSISDNQLWSAAEHRLYRSATIERLWNHGNVILAPYSWATGCYCAGYISSKLTGQAAKQYEQLGVEPPSSRMSRRPGIAADYVKACLTLNPTGMLIVPGEQSKVVQYHRQAWLKLRDLNPKRYEILHARYIDAIEATTVSRTDAQLNQIEELAQELRKKRRTKN